MKRNKLGVNIVGFGNVYQLLRSLILESWDFRGIGKVCRENNLYLMMLPVRGAKKLRPMDLGDKVLSLEEAWNNASFFPAVLKMLKDLKYLVSGSPAKTKGSSSIDRIAGMNFSNQGTLIDWLLFGKERDSYLGFVNLLRMYPNSIVSYHSGSGVVVEIHPEFRREVCKNLNISHQGFIRWLMHGNQKMCIDLFHTFHRGSRDGLEPNPVVPECLRMEFLKEVKDRVPEVHFRLNRYEIELILSGKTKELPLFREMRYMYTNYEAIFILEVYPEFFTPLATMAKKVRKVWDILDEELSH